MESAIFDWLQLLGRWAHIITGIAWIGSSFFFMWLDRNLDRSPDHPKGVEGQLWMVHSGGFYAVEKRQLAPEQVPKVLHWFKWEAAFTWITGMFLLLIIFYTGQGLYLLDATVSDISFAQGVALGLSSIILSWVVYDTSWKYLGHQKYLPHIICLFGLIGIAYLLAHTLSGRAAYIHIGAIMGTCMVANVWLRILPNQGRMIENTLAGKPHASELGLKSKQRSTHNNYMTLPVIFIMLSNHFPATYGHSANWLLLLWICLAGACIRAYYNKTASKGRWLPFVPATLALAISFFMTLPGPEEFSDPSHEVVQISDQQQASPQNSLPEGDVDKGVRSVKAPLGAPGTIRGHINFTGITPSKVALQLPAKCLKLHAGREVYDNRILLRGKKLQNVLVSIKGPIPKAVYPVPPQQVVLDQVGCLYHPRTIGVQVGQEVVFKNSDPVFHNVKSVAQQNTNFNVGMPHKGMKKIKKFTRPELVVQAKCSLHPWMGANIGVFDHPFFSVSNQAGEFFINQVPPGEYVIEAWHEALGTTSKKILLRAGEQVIIDFAFL